MKRDLKVDVTVDVLIKTWFDKDEGFWYASSPYVDVVQHGNTEKQALDRFKTVFEVLVSSSIRKGTILEIFKRSGYKVEIDESNGGNLRLNLTLPGRAIKSKSLGDWSSLIPWNKRIQETAGRELCRA
ncbi:MAG: hypothetical protein HRF49_07800 [bacterium]